MNNDTETQNRPYIVSVETVVYSGWGEVVTGSILSAAILAGAAPLLPGMTAGGAINKNTVTMTVGGALLRGTTSLGEIIIDSKHE